MNPPPDYYNTFGLPASASQDDIKKRYRELARRYHPDVNPSPDAALKIKAVNEAYHTLGDPDRRATYDAYRVLNAASKPAAPSKPEAASPAASARPASPTNSARPSRPASAPRPAAPPRTERAASPPRADRPTPSQRSAPDRTWEFDGFGRKPPESAPPPKAPSSGAPPRAPSKPPQPEAVNPRGAVVQNLVSEAQLAFINRRYREAETFCQQALRLDRRNAVIYEILGDIYARRGQTESAATAYSYAIQFNPRNYSVHGKLDRLIGKRDVAAMGPTVTRRVPGAGRALNARPPSRDTAIILLSLLMVSAFAGIIVSFRTNPGQAVAPGLPWIPALSPNLIITLLCNGTIAGMLIAFYGGMRPISEEMVHGNSAGAGKGSPVALIVLLALFAFVWFYISLGVYIAVAVTRNSFSRSLLRVYGLVLGLIALFACVATSGFESASVSTIVGFSGNLLFPAALAGWYLGDSMRMRRN